jgi:hypothetical protein
MSTNFYGSQAPTGGKQPHQGVQDSSLIQAALAEEDLRPQGASGAATGVQGFDISEVAAGAGAAKGAYVQPEHQQQCWIWVKATCRSLHP